MGGSDGSPLPTPEPDPFCHRSTCIDYGSVLYRGVDLVQSVVDEVRWCVDNFDTDDDICPDWGIPPGSEPMQSSSSSVITCDELG